MSQSQTQCPVHGREDIGLVCEHIALAVDRGERVGFFWGDDTNTARPDAWCLVPSMGIVRAVVPRCSFQGFLCQMLGCGQTHLRRIYGPVTDGAR
jgi:hypothetical protein